jgi:hypothetical protein
MKRLPVIAILMVIMALAWSPLRAAKDEAKGDQYYPELQGDEDMRSVESKKNMLSSGVSYGAWITPTFLYEEAPQNSISSMVTTFRVWFKTYLWDDSFLYLRAKDTYTWIIKERGARNPHDKNVVDLDIGYIGMASKKREVDFSVGRKYFILGSGLVFDGRGDGAELNYYSKYINFKALGTWTGWLAKDDNPYGLSDRDISTGAKRVFAGGKVYWEFYNQCLYAIGLAQFDFGKEYYNRKYQLTAAAIGSLEYFKYFSQKSHYDSQYYGAGLEGVIVSGLSYSGEFVMERGRSYLTGYYILKDILAYAGQFKLSYFINVMLKPVIQANYAFGSGDTNRKDYRLPNGNMWGKDRGFLYFGTFVGGYALKPLLANLHMISGSVSFSPFSWSDKSHIKNMTLTVKYIYYLKYKTWSPINYGLDATKPNRYIGQGVDVSLRWLLLSDFSIFCNYGLFLPGKAFGYYYDFVWRTTTYSSGADRHFVMTGCNISF